MTSTPPTGFAGAKQTTVSDRRPGFRARTAGSFSATPRRFHHQQPQYIHKQNDQCSPSPPLIPSTPQPHPLPHGPPFSAHSPQTFQKHHFKLSKKNKQTTINHHHPNKSGRRFGPRRGSRSNGDGTRPEPSPAGPPLRRTRQTNVVAPPPPPRLDQCVSPPAGSVARRDFLVPGHPTVGTPASTSGVLRSRPKTLVSLRYHRLCSRVARGAPRTRDRMKATGSPKDVVARTRPPNPTISGGAPARRGWVLVIGRHSLRFLRAATLAGWANGSSGQLYVNLGGPWRADPGREPRLRVPYEPR